ncbi:Wadjet anti-phage system protein JetD domain-containing protein [Heliorestis acidaminivorans]|uniref:Wadjet anti-phage system protein JetD domain-containing protein n=1 Tax=Heliorestis acidaminivorans TaxID=553427 RepID=UPI0014789DC9|nr:Wadjet anti-phage system protein JetD domain-containing protein [Heliorestis acidaminivorans]
MQYLKKSKKKRVLTSDLEALVPGMTKYDEFAQSILQLVTDKILDPVSAQGTNQRSPELHNAYSIKKQHLGKSYHEEIRTLQLQLHPALQLDGYFSLPETTWRKEKPWLHKIDSYLKEQGFPKEETSPAERSFALLGDEKWISQGGGKSFLERLQLYEAFKIAGQADPLMFSINPRKLTSQKHLHLIVENKGTYSALAPFLTATVFTTLIYGAGKAILSSISHLESQLNLPSPEYQHHLYYFGDLDYEGIYIWYLLQQRRPAQPALNFYEALLDEEATKGKEAQRREEKAVQAFLEHFPEKKGKNTSTLLQKGYYLPQEALSTKKLHQLWMNPFWERL